MDNLEISGSGITETDYHNHGIPYEEEILEEKITIGSLVLHIERLPHL